MGMGEAGRRACKMEDRVIYMASLEWMDIGGIAGDVDFDILNFEF